MDEKLKKTSLCKWRKDEVKANLKNLYDLVGNPEFICTKCLRSSRLEGTLCKAEKLPRPA